MGAAHPFSSTARERRVGIASAHTPARDNYYLGIAITIAAVVAIGFGRNIDARLVHPVSPLPSILYLHVALFTGWVLLFILQAALVRVGSVAWHRRLGWVGLAIGGLMPPVGIETALVMTRFHRAGANVGGERSLILPVFDMLAFAVTFGLTIYWRRRPEYHRRLILVATCGLTVAAFARFPSWLVPNGSWYLCVDVLILSGVIRDWLRTRRIHIVYACAMPLIALGQAATMWIYVTGPPLWVSIARSLLQ